MARQKKSGDKEEDVTTISNSPLEDIPESPGEMTKAAAAVAPREPIQKERSAKNDDPPKPAELKWFRVLQTKRIMGSTGFRAVMREGKEFNNLQYNPSKLKAQGVKFEPIDVSEVSNPY